MATDLDWQRYAKDLIKLLEDNEFELLKRFIELFGDMNDRDITLPAGNGPEMAAKRLREAKLTTLTRMVTSMLPEVKIPKKSYKPSHSTSVADHHPVMHAHYAVDHLDAQAANQETNHLQEKLTGEEPTWVIANDMRQILHCEGDTSAMYCMNAIKPCVELLNLKLSSWYQRQLEQRLEHPQQMELHVRAQYSSWQKRTYGSRQDYTIVFHDPQTHNERPVALIEFKQPDVIDLTTWKSQAVEGVVVTARELKKALRWFPQVLQYAGDLSISHSAVADGRTFLPLVVGDLVDLSEADKVNKAKAIAELPKPNEAVVPKSAYKVKTWDSEIMQPGNGSTVSAGLSLAYLLHSGLKSVAYGGPRVGAAHIEPMVPETIDLTNPEFRVTRKPHQG